MLNNLQKEAKDQPTLMFFPGEYAHSPNTRIPWKQALH
ncbi:hypothetical protein [Thiolapillus sp.]